MQRSGTLQGLIILMNFGSDTKRMAPGKTQHTFMFHFFDAIWYRSAAVKERDN